MSLPNILNTVYYYINIELSNKWGFNNNSNNNNKNKKNDKNNNSSYFEY